MVQRLVHGCRNPLSDQAVEVDGATEELQNAQGKKSLESRDVEDDTAVTLRNGKKNIGKCAYCCRQPGQPLSADHTRCFGG